MSRTLFAVLCLLPLLAGCAVGPDYRPFDLRPPATWSSPASGKGALSRLDNWWTDFGDPVLDSLVAEVVAGSLDVATAKAKVRQARAERQEASASLFPQASGSASGLREGGGSSTVLGAGGVTSQFHAGLDASWELDIFGANARSEEAASRGEKAAREDLKAVLVTLVGDVAVNYVEARGYRARIALARRSFDAEQKTAALTRIKLDAGIGNAVDVAKADAISASTRANVPGFEASFAQAVHRLSVLTGREPGALEARLRKGSAIPTPYKRLPAGVPADLLRNRPDVRAADLRFAQSTALVGAAAAARYPSISLTGTLSTSGVRPVDLAKASNLAWSFGPSLTVPLFDAGRLAAAQEVAEAERDQAFVAFKAAVLSAMENVEDDLVALAKEREREASLSSAAEGYRKASDLSRGLYDAGQSTFLDVLDAERSLYSAEDALIQSRVAVALDHVALAKALGGGWRKPVEVDKPEVSDKDTAPRLRTASR